MRITIDKFNRRFRFVITLNKIVEVEGIDSILDNGKHILLWDFDEVEYKDLRHELVSIQNCFDLGTIRIVYSGNPNHYHAYCFDEVSYPIALHILAETKFICQTFFKMGVMRGYWTLRISPEKGDFRLVDTLYSHGLNAEIINQLTSHKYRTVKHE